MSTRFYSNELHKQVRVVTNDPARSEVTFTVQARIVELLGVTPRMVNFGKMLQNETSARELTVENLGKSPVRILSVEAKPDGLLSIGQEGPFDLGPGESRKMRLTISSGTSRGFVHGYVKIRTDLKDLPDKIVRVRADVKEPRSTGRSG